jgi:hypothetical protein
MKDQPKAEYSRKQNIGYSQKPVLDNERTRDAAHFEEKNIEKRRHDLESCVTVKA